MTAVLTVALFRKGQFQDPAVEVWVLHREVDQALQKLFRRVPPSTPRGYYVDCWRTCGIDLKNLQESLRQTAPEPRASSAVFSQDLPAGGSFAGEVIRENVKDGLTGEQREIQYTQCKIVGNGSFGVVFQTKLSPSGADAAIKRVLQDKRFKVTTTT